MTVMPIASNPQPTSPSPALGGYFSDPATRWDAIKFLTPLIVGFVALQMTLYYGLQDTRTEVKLLTDQVVVFQSTKESRIQQITQLQTRQDSEEKQIDKIGQQVDAIYHAYLDRGIVNK